MKHLLKHTTKAIKHLHKHKHHYALATFGSFALVKMLALFAGFFGLMQLGNTYAANTTVYWNGNGWDNNRTTAANWSGSQVPNGVTYDIVFTGGAGNVTKNVTIDTSITINSITISTWYTGTLTQSTWSDITINGAGWYTQNGGTFQWWSGVFYNKQLLTLNWWTFNAPKLIQFDWSSSSYGFTFNTGTFNHNSWTVECVWYIGLKIFKNIDFYNLIVNWTYLAIYNNGFSANINGDLTLKLWQIFGGTLLPKNTVTVKSTFGGGISEMEIK